MLRKVVLAGAVSVKLILAGMMAHFLATAPTTTEPEEQQIACWRCAPDLDCYPGDPCMNCY